MLAGNNLKIICVGFRKEYKSKFFLPMLFYPLLLESIWFLCMEKTFFSLDKVNFMPHFAKWETLRPLKQIDFQKIGIFFLISHQKMPAWRIIIFTDLFWHLISFWAIIDFFKHSKLQVTRFPCRKMWLL